jgi:hypothetical protein
MKIDVNSVELIKYSDKLEYLSKKALGYAIKNTLNNAAFDMKKKTILKSAEQNFDGFKSPNFFKKYTGVSKATESNINQMTAMVGIVPSSNSKVKKALDGLEKQEFGGDSDGFSYLKDARAGSKLDRYVSNKKYYDKENVISGRSKGKSTRKSAFVARAYRAHKEGKTMFMNNLKGNFLAEVKSFRKTKKGLKIKTKLLMKERENTKIKPTKFMSEAGEESQMKMPQYYIKEAGEQIKRLK